MPDGGLAVVSLQRDDTGWQREWTIAGRVVRREFFIGGALTAIVEYQSDNGVELERWLEPDGRVDRERSVREEPLRQEIDYRPRHASRRVDTWQGDGGIEVRLERRVPDGGWVLENRRMRPLYETFR